MCVCVCAFALHPERARAGRVAVVGRGDKLVDATWIDNAVDAHLLAAERLAPGAACAGRAYFIAQGEPAPSAEHMNGILEAAGLPRATPVLPLPDAERTLIVADTSSLHCRGLAEPGLTRRALRPMGAENDGGVKRSDPFRRGRS